MALPLVAGVAFSAAAGTISSVQVPYSQSIKLTGGTLGSSTMTASYAGQVVLTTDAGILGAWCVDLYHDVYIGGQYSYVRAELGTDNRTPTAYTLSPSVIDGIQQLAAFGNAVLDAVTSQPYTISAELSAAYTAGLDAYKAANASTYTYIRNNISAFSAAIQASIWELEYGTRASGSTAFTTLMGLVDAGSRYFDNIGGYQMNLTNSANARVQRQYTPEIPEPASLSLLALGLLALAFAVARRKPGQA